MLRRDGRGLSDLLAALDAALDASPARRDIGRPRLPIDRVFTITGFGTVVTGALQDGVLHTRQEVEVAPHGLRVRVRGLQTHKRVVEEGRPGGRLAINLAGVAKADIARGDVVTLPGLLRPTTALDVRLHALAGAPRAIPHGAMLDVYVGAFETTARVLLLDRDELPPGESGWAQLRLARPTVAARGDRFIARAPSPSMTVGGGMIVDPWARRHRRRDPAILARLETLERGAPDAITLLALAGDTTRAVSGGQDDSQLAHSTGLHASERAEALRLLGERGRATQVGARWYATSVWERLRARSLALLADYHREYPLRWGMPREAWRARLGLASAEVADVIAALAALGEAAEGAGSSGGNAGARQSGRSSATVRLPTHAPRFTPEQECRVSAVLARFAADPFAPPTRAEVEAEVGAEALAALVERETLVRLSDAILLERAAYDEVIRRVVAHLRAYDTLTVAQARDLLSTSRKYMLAIFESLDERRITQRRGDDRVLGPNAPIESPDA